MSLENISLDIDFVRSKFPAFNDPLSKKWSFFENAGGSYVPQTVFLTDDKLKKNIFIFHALQKNKYLHRIFLCDVFIFNKMHSMNLNKIPSLYTLGSPESKKWPVDITHLQKRPPFTPLLNINC